MKKFLALILIVCTFAFFFTINQPHDHKTKPGHHQHSCGVCKIQSGYSALHEFSTIEVNSEVIFLNRLFLKEEIFLEEYFSSFNFSRAPPVLS